MDVGHCYLEGNADAVEFCPHDSFHNVLATSTYNLQEGDRPSRSGSISLFDVDADAGRLDLTHRLETAGIFDIKWSPGFGQDAGHPLLAQADADGYVRIHSLRSSNLDGSDVCGNCLKEVCGKHVSSSMCLCIDWNPSSTCMTVGLSDGSVSIISIHESQLSILQDWKAHEFEVWATSFDVHQPQLVYTGSDDCKFSCWDWRDDPSNSVFQNTKVHKMGICSIAKSPNDPNIVLTGCYDEHLRIWDVRSISYPISETSIRLGGGVWRIKHHPSIPGLILTACMHNGFAVVKIKGGRAEVNETYKKHDSLAYGADWQRGDSYVAGRRKSKAIATCSFYDRLLRVWIPEVNMEQPHEQAVDQYANQILA
ncbi:Transducin/WD40 repeat-like superfamily protein [Forsythia ovata]|uniref:methylated diphthine methylhydrolase n=1 Tax=Forsythia ovata TaxID=205694 RepID=A0ABD1P6G0_9LAMI